MNDSMWEAVAEAALAINDAMDGPFGFRSREVRSELEAIIGHLVCSRPDDLPARAVTLLVDAWLTAARDDDFRFDFGDDDDAEDGEVSAPRP